MNVYNIIYKINTNNNLINIFQTDFFIKNKSRFKIIYKNKLMDLSSKIPVEKGKKEIKIKLISLFNISNNNKDIFNKAKFYIANENQTPFKIVVENKLKKKAIHYNAFILEYKFNSKIKIFGYDFVKNNKDKCLIMYNNIFFELDEYISIENFKENCIDVMFIELENIEDKSYMFHECILLEKIVDLKEKKEKGINLSKCYLEDSKGRLDIAQQISEKSLFFGEDHVSNAKKTSLFNDVKEEFTYNTKNDDELEDDKKYKEIFQFNSETNKMIERTIIKNEYSSKKKTDLEIHALLSFILDESLSVFTNVNNMEHMFDGCTSLISLPDISNWKTNNIKTLNSMFKQCSTLETLPDISKWKLNNITNMENYLMDVVYYYLYLIYLNGR